MKQTILITGCDGYMGWPTMLKTARMAPDALVVGVDNGNRRAWVGEMGSTSAIPILDMAGRLEAAAEAGIANLEYAEGDLADMDFVRGLKSRYAPGVIVHMAAQPSAPYSHESLEKAAYTQEMNMAMTRNLLWALREAEDKKTHFIETTTTGIYGAPNFDIPEGFLTARGADGREDRVHYPNLATSWYHVSKGFNATNMQLNHFQTRLPTTDIRTSIVFGTETAETRQDPRLATRFDFDFHFGTLFNRWCAMAVLGKPLTIYGTGQQIKPFISLEDAALSIANAALDGNPGEYRVYNQLTLYSAIKDMAEIIVSEGGALLDEERSVTYIPNPRVEIEDTEYRFANDKFLPLLKGKAPETLSEVIPGVLARLVEHRSILEKYATRFMK